MYHARVTLATTARVLRQLSHDRRSLGMIYLVPCLLLFLLHWLYANNTLIFNSIAPALVGIFPFIIMFLITSITTLRERTSGTLERLLTTRAAKADIILGYVIGFGIIASLQALLTSVIVLYGLGLSIAGPHSTLIGIAVLDAVLGVALGVGVSAFARTEFQAVQFMPAIIFPQLLIGGLLLPLGQMPELLERIAYCLPLTYAIDALQRIAQHSQVTSDVWRDVWVLGAFFLGGVILASASLRRRTR